MKARSVTKKFAGRAKYAPPCAMLAAMGIALACAPERYVPVCFEGIALWAECVLPALFPFMVITMLLIRLGGAQAAARPFERACGFLGLPAAAAAIFVMAAFSGYPAGSRIVCEYRERGLITDADAQRLAPLCSVSGPLFITGSVGQNMFGDKAAGAYMLAAHLISVAAVSVLLCLPGRHRDERPRTAPAAAEGGALYDCFCSAALSVIVAGAFICFFYTAARMAADFNLLLPLSTLLKPLLGECSAAFCRGLVEATGGCAALAACGGALAVPLAGAVITFGGASIIMQQLCYLTKCGVKPAKFILVKAAQSAVCFVLLLPAA